MVFNIELILDKGLIIYLTINVDMSIEYLDHVMTI